MQKKSLVLGIASVAVLAMAPGAFGTDKFIPAFISSAQAAEVDISIFFDELAPHGRWLSTRSHGYVWVPASVEPDWRPYSRGHWAYTRVNGWFWVSDEAYGWAVYHYGRWGYDDEYGYFWVPGSKWAPAWVSWHYSDEYTGWAALPPTEPGYAFSVNVGDVAIGVGAWRFVPTRDFLNTNIETHILAGTRNPELLGATRSAGSGRVVNNIVVNNVINVTNVERMTKTTVVVNEVMAADKPGRVTQSGQEVRAFQPPIATSQPKAAPKQAAAADAIDNKPAALKVDSKAQGTGKIAGQPLTGSQAGPNAEPQPNQPAASKVEPEPKQKAEPKTEPQPNHQAEPKGVPEPKQKAEPRAEPQPKHQAEPKGVPAPKQKAEPKAEPQPKQQAEPKDVPESKQKAEPKAEPQPKQRSEPKGPSEPKQRAEPKPEPQAKQQPEPKAQPEPKGPAEPK